MYDNIHNALAMLFCTLGRTGCNFNKYIPDMYSFTGKIVHYLLLLNYWALFYKDIKNVHDTEKRIRKRNLMSKS